MKIQAAARKIASDSKAKHDRNRAPVIAALNIRARIDTPAMGIVEKFKAPSPQNKHHAFQPSRQRLTVRLSH
jgi:hypothetical protein